MKQQDLTGRRQTGMLLALTIGLLGGSTVTGANMNYVPAFRIAKEGSRSTVVWNPWVAKAARLADMGDDEYLRMLCVETANARPAISSPR